MYINNFTQNTIAGFTYSGMFFQPLPLPNIDPNNPNLLTWYWYTKSNLNYDLPILGGYQSVVITPYA